MEEQGTLKCSIKYIHVYVKNLIKCHYSTSNLYRAELLEADDEALCCSGLRPGPSLSSPQSSMSTSLRERGTDSVPETTPRRRPSPWAFNDSLRARRTETVGLCNKKNNWMKSLSVKDFEEFLWADVEFLLQLDFRGTCPCCLLPGCWRTASGRRHRLLPPLPRRRYSQTAEWCSSHCRDGLHTQTDNTQCDQTAQTHTISRKSWCVWNGLESSNYTQFMKKTYIFLEKEAKFNQIVKAKKMQWYENKYLRWVTTGHGMLQNQKNEPNRNNEIRTTGHNEKKSTNQ